MPNLGSSGAAAVSSLSARGGARRAARNQIKQRNGNSPARAAWLTQSRRKLAGALRDGSLRPAWWASTHGKRRIQLPRDCARRVDTSKVQHAPIDTTLASQGLHRTTGELRLWYFVEQKKRGPSSANSRAPTHCVGWFMRVV